jgi:hypothetical protein
MHASPRFPEFSTQREFIIRLMKLKLQRSSLPFESPVFNFICKILYYLPLEIIHTSFKLHKVWTHLAVTVVTKHLAPKPNNSHLEPYGIVTLSWGSAQKWHHAQTSHPEKNTHNPTPCIHICGHMQSSSLITTKAF